METVRTGFAHRSTLIQDLAETKRKSPRELVVHEDCVYTVIGLAATNLERPGPALARAALREGDTLVVSRVDRLAYSVPNARAFAEVLEKRRVKLVLGTTGHGPAVRNGDDVPEHRRHLG